MSFICVILAKWNIGGGTVLQSGTYLYTHYIAPHYITLHCTTVHYMTLHYTTLHYIVLHYIQAFDNTYTYTNIILGWQIVEHHNKVIPSPVHIKHPLNETMV